MSHKTLQRLKTLPSASSPLVVFMGLEDGGKVAVFMLTGDGHGRGRRHLRPAARTAARR